MKCAIITSENLASNAITTGLLSGNIAHIKHIFILPNVPTKGSKNKGRTKRLLVKTVWQFVLFKALEIFASTFIRTLLRTTIHAKAQQKGIPTSHFPEPDTPELLKKLRELDCDILISSGPSILSSELLKIPNKFTLNCHCARLPDYQGPANYLWMSLDQVKEAYVAIQIMEPKIDSGPVIAESAMARQSNWSVYEFNWHLAKFAGKFYANTIDTILLKQYEGVIPSINDNRECTPQNRGFPTTQDFLKLKKLGIPLIRVTDIFKYF